MNFIEHPAYSEQNHAIQSILSEITLENVNRLLQRFQLKCISFEHLKTSGRINFIFNLTVQSHENLSSFELILKICNPHIYWKEYRTKNEVYAMQYLLEHTTIPIPKIIDYSMDMKTSLLSCEYILMEKIVGKTLESAMETISNETVLITALELIDYIKQLRQMILPEMNQIGSFKTKDMSLGGTIEDGPTLGPFDHIKDYVIQHLLWSIRRIQTDEQLSQHGGYLITRLKEIIHHAENDSNLLELQMKCYFTHTDLNTSNILIDETTGKIVGILDWERCAMTPDSNDVEFYRDWFENDQEIKQFQSILHWTDQTSNTPSTKYYLNIVHSAMYATFYSSTWFTSEQTVLEHIQRFLKETEVAISIFNEKYLKENK